MIEQVGVDKALIKGRLHVTVYEKGPKALVQGNEAGEFARDVLEPMVMGG